MEVKQRIDNQKIFCKVERCIYQALIGEVQTSPKPGLVDLIDCGAHQDMNYHTFVKSAQAITPYLSEMAWEGYRWNFELSGLFQVIQKIGMQAEMAMYQATNGVNTHKGMIFSMGILTAAAGYCYQKYQKFSAVEILNIGQKLAGEYLMLELEEMKDRTPKTNGEMLYHLYGNPGIRGEVVEGFPTIRTIAYPAMKQCYASDKNHRNLHVLLQIMATLNDTNILSRGNHQELAWVKKTARHILDKGSCFCEEGYRAIVDMNVQCIKKNISPGGAADLLAVTILLCEIEKI